MEEKVIRPFYHHHPLILKENVSKEEEECCYGCGNVIANLEMAYVCMEHNCSSPIILHNKCGELPSEIRHPKHPNHRMHLFDFHTFEDQACDVCLNGLDNVLGYRCSSCNFDVDITCEKIGIDMILEERKELQHPSHPDHPLTLMRKPAFAFRCDGCGDQDVDMAYICSTCEYWVHKSCAELPLRRECRHHHHHLSLAFSFPKEHRKFTYACGVCVKLLDRTCWVYFCGDCKYFVHINCVGSTTTPDSNLINEDEEEDGSGVIQFPLCAEEISNKLIMPFVMREKGVDNIIPIPDVTASTSNSFLFKDYHDHPLSLVSEEANDDEELIKICDVCVTPISSPPYYQCPNSACLYFIHSICSLLPNTLHSSSPNLLQLYGNCQEIPNKNHNFLLYKSKVGDFNLHWDCKLCENPTNGMGYECEECKTKIDVKCASLPAMIQYSSHPRHHKPLVPARIVPPQGKGKGKGKGKINKNFCRCCGCEIDTPAFCCSEDDCDFGLDVDCLLMPMSVTDSEWDNKHPLLLTPDAFLDHPSDFFCDFCEEEMHPQLWMHHCRECDLSFHPSCLETAAGVFRNIKFGRRYEVDGIHPNHPLTYAYVTLKRRCDVCHDEVYAYPGFECASCYCVVCKSCVRAELHKIGE